MSNNEYREPQEAARAHGLKARQEQRLANAQERLYDKFRVERTDPEAQERHKDCWMFVLDPQHDPIARAALAAYATAAVAAGNLDIAVDLRLKLREIATREASA